VSGSSSSSDGPQNDPIPQRRLRLTSVSPSPKLTIVGACGEIDIAGAEDFDSCLGAAAGALGPDGRLVVDLSAVSFLGACAVRSLLHAERLAAARGGRVQVVIPPGPARLPLEALGVLERLQVISSRGENA